VKGLKTSSSFWVQNPQNQGPIPAPADGSYGYDPALDYLTSASYNGRSAERESELDL